MPAPLQVRAVHIILNASAGLDGKTGTADTLRRVLKEAGVEADIHETSRGTDLCDLTQRLIAEKAEVIVAGGGDGTINAVASVLAGTGVVLGVLPVGTLNHFARDLDIPFDPEKAMQVIAEGHTVEVDVGEVNGRRFINNAILGLYPSYWSHRERAERRGRPAWMAVPAAMFSVFRWNPALRLRIEIDGIVHTRKTPFLMVANNHHEMEGYKLGHRESLTEGQLWVYTMHRMTRWGLSRLALSVIFGMFSKRGDFDYSAAQSVVVQSHRKKIGVSLDGEVVRMTPPLEYRSLPRSLRVIVPASYAASH